MAEDQLEQDDPGISTRIEVIKAGSAFLWWEAMAGVINCDQRGSLWPRLEGEVKTFYGSCNTFGGLMSGWEGD